MASEPYKSRDGLARWRERDQSRREYIDELNHVRDTVNPAVSLLPPDRRAQTIALYSAIVAAVVVLAGIVGAVRRRTAGGHGK